MMLQTIDVQVGVTIIVLIASTAATGLTKFAAILCGMPGWHLLARLTHLGEAGAKAAHGFSGRLWQAEQAAKMIAWVNSRPDYPGIAFYVGHEYDWGYGRLWDYSMGHKPGEAALYTAGALIDGLPYKAADTQDANVQAA